MKFRTAYGEKIDASISFEHEETLTKEFLKEECDINYILKRYMQTGVIDHLASKKPIYDDVSSLGDLHECYRKIDAAEEAFFELPASIREKFKNDPIEFVEFVQNPNNEDALVTMGLAKKRADTSTQPDPVPSV